jgi:hypothetical protein
MSLILLADQRYTIQKNQTIWVCIIQILTTAGVKFKLYFAYLEFTVVKNTAVSASNPPQTKMIRYT